MEAGFCRRPDCAHLGSPRNRIPCDTLTRPYLDSGTWTEAPWTGRPRHEYPTVGMQMTQSQTIESHKSRETNATALRDRVPADGRNSEMTVTNVQLTCASKCKLSDKSSEKQSHGTRFSQSICMYTFVAHCMSAMFRTAHCPLVRVPSTHSTSQRMWTKTCANHPVDLRRVAPLHFSAAYDSERSLRM